jgi:sulfonate transport system ATP-binding protein
MSDIDKNRAYVKIKNLCKSYDERPVLEGINLKVNQGEFIAIVGKSGCGKSTLLRLLAGLEKSDSGTIEMNGSTLTSLNQNARIMFQDGRLLPWKKVIDNIGIGLKGNWKEQAIEALKNVGLEDREKDWPRKLSGGQKQRVALARALVHQPDLLLLDEPLGALDALTRIEMQDLIERICIKKKLTSILVTHDVEEAVAMADRVIVIEEGNISLYKSINLPRPRQRTHPSFNTIVEEILGKITGASQENLSLVHDHPKKTSIK